MKKDKAWLIQKVSDIFWRVEIDGNFNIQNANIMFDDISNLIDELDEPEKPVIPQFVADYIEKWKRGGLAMREWFTFDYDDYDDDGVAKWLYDNTAEENRRREFLLIDAIRNGYEMEKEKKYRVVFRSHKDDLILFKTGEHIFIGAESANGGYWKQHFTESEIKAIDERYWAFKEEVKD